MKSNRKTVLKGFSYLQCDDFAAYLSEMAAKGWHFTQWGAGLVFEKGMPEKVQYAVEVFIDGSEYDTRPEVHTQEFAEYCEAAGWKLVDAKRKFVIFRKIREDAADILTPSERLENIAKEEKKDILQKTAIACTWTVLQFVQFTGAEFANRIFSNGLLLISAVWLSLAICAVIRFLHYLVWKKAWTRKTENGESLYLGATKNLFAFTNGWYSWLSTGIITVFLAGLIFTEQFGTVIMILVFAAIMIVMGYLIARFRPDAVTHQMIQLIVVAVLTMGVLTVSVALVLTDNTVPEETVELPLYYEDIGGEAGEIRGMQIDQSDSIFGSGMRCWIEYEEEYVYYYVYTSDHPWVIDTIWEEQMERIYNQNCDDVTALFGAISAVRNVNGVYLVKYPDTVLILNFAQDTVLTSADTGVIGSALMERR